MIQIFKTIPSKEGFINFIKIHTNKERNYYKITNDVYKQMVFKQVITPFLETVRPHYHLSKLFYINRKMTYSRFITIIRHICKIVDITYTSNMKYSNSSYRIDYYIYL
jgi:hypothetical protein